MVYIELWIAIATLFISFVGLVWKLGRIYGDVLYQLKDNRKDINGVGQSLRREFKRDAVLSKLAIFDMQRHLADKTGYKPIRFNVEPEEE